MSFQAGPLLVGEVGRVGLSHAVERTRSPRTLSLTKHALRESLETSLEILAEDPVLRVLLKRIPLVGDSLTELAAGKGQQIIEARRDEFLELLAERIGAVEGQAIRKDYFETPEGFDLLIKALDESRRTRSREKRDLYARVLAGAATVQTEQEGYSAEEYLNLISDLTLQELRVARSLYLANPEREEGWAEWKAKVCDEFSVSNDDLPIILSRIRAAGLIKDVFAGEDGDYLWIDPDDAHYEATASFKRMMVFLGIG